MGQGTLKKKRAQHRRKRDAELERLYKLRNGLIYELKDTQDKIDNLLYGSSRSNAITWIDGKQYKL